MHRRGPSSHQRKPRAGAAGAPEAVLDLKRQSMEAMNSFMARQTASDSAPATAAQDLEDVDVDVMEEPADVAVEDDAIQQLATQSPAQGKRGKRKRGGAKTATPG